jgi:DnaJ-domain-containing protein 1
MWLTDLCATAVCALRLQIVAEERRQGALRREADAAAAAAGSETPQQGQKTHRKAPPTKAQQQQRQTLGEKQADRVEALRSAQSSEAELAATRARLSSDIIVQLNARVRGKTLRQALTEFGVAVARDVPEADAIASAYRKALAKYHPDRAMRKGLSLAAQVEAEETYKLLQNLHEDWSKRAARANDSPFAANAASRRNTAAAAAGGGGGGGWDDWSSAAGHAYGAGRRGGGGGAAAGGARRPGSAGSNASGAPGGRWSANQARQQQVFGSSFLRVSFSIMISLGTMRRQRLSRLILIAKPACCW